MKIKKYSRVVEASSKVKRKGLRVISMLKPNKLEDQKLWNTQQIR